MCKTGILISLLIYSNHLISQVNWKNVDSLYQPLPKSVHVFFSDDSIDGKPNIAYYIEAKLSDRSLSFDTDTTHKRRLTPTQFYQKNKQPLVVVNTTFFEFVNNSNLNVVVKNGRIVSYNNHSIVGRGKDTFTYRHPFASAIGITRSRAADVAWTYTDPDKKFVYATQTPYPAFRDSSRKYSFKTAKYLRSVSGNLPSLQVWKMQTAVGGGPVLIQNGGIRITNDEEIKFAGKAINDKHPRTSMGYTPDGRLIILAIQGRAPGIAEGASLIQQANMLKQIGCTEALNLDGGGSSCLLINGKETIKPSDKEGQRPVPAVFMIKQMKNEK